MAHYCKRSDILSCPNEARYKIAFMYRTKQGAVIVTQIETCGDHVFEVRSNQEAYIKNVIQPAYYHCMVGLIEGMNSNPLD